MANLLKSFRSGLRKFFGGEDRHDPGVSAWGESRLKAGGLSEAFRVGSSGKNSKIYEAFREIAPGFVATMGIDEQGFRSSELGPLDLSRSAWLRLISRSQHYCTFNPIGVRATSIRTDIVSAGGMRPVSVHPDPEVREFVQSVLDEHWELNGWDLHLRSRIRDSMIQGEMIRMRVPQDAATSEIQKTKWGRGIRFGDFHPSEVYSAITDKLDRRSVKELTLNFDWNDPEKVRAFTPTNRPRIKTVYRGTFADGEDAGKVTGDAIFLPFNGMLGMTRGLPDITPAMEWLDLHQAVFLAGVDRAQLVLNFIYEIIKEGASPDEIDELSQKFALYGIGPSSAQCHDGSLKFAIHSPDLASADIDKMVDMLFKLVWGSLGLPEHWYTAANTVNKASAQEMGDPVYMWARARREYFETAVALEIELALYESLKYGKLSSVPNRVNGGKGLTKEDLAFALVGTDPDPDRFVMAANIIKQTSEGLLLATAGGLMDEPTAIFVFRRALESTGIDLPTDGDQEDPDMEGSMSGGRQVDPEDGHKDETTADQLGRMTEAAMNRLDRNSRDWRESRPMKRGLKIWVPNRGPVRKLSIRAAEALQGEIA